MAAGTLDLSELLKDIPRGAWVAISEDGNHVITFGAEMRSVLAEARAKAESNPIILRVPETPSSLIL